MPDQALRFSEGKHRLSLVQLAFLRSMIKVMEFGCRKYSRDNWKKSAGGPDHDDFVRDRADSLWRHYEHRFLEGEVTDKESGESHMAAVAVNAMFIWFYDLNAKKP